MNMMHTLSWTGGGHTPDDSGHGPLPKAPKGGTGESTPVKDKHILITCPRCKSIFDDPRVNVKYRDALDGQAALDERDQQIQEQQAVLDLLRMLLQPDPEKGPVLVGALRFRDALLCGVRNLNWDSDAVLKAAQVRIQELREKVDKYEGAYYRSCEDEGLKMDHTMESVVAACEKKRQRIQELEKGLQSLLGEVNCRREHGAEGAGHLKYIEDRLGCILKSDSVEPEACKTCSVGMNDQRCWFKGAAKDCDRVKDGRVRE